MRNSELLGPTYIQLSWSYGIVGCTLQSPFHPPPLPLSVWVLEHCSIVYSDIGIKYIAFISCA